MEVRSPPSASDPLRQRSTLVPAWEREGTVFFFGEYRIEQRLGEWNVWKSDSVRTLAWFDTLDKAKAWAEGTTVLERQDE